MKAAGDEDNDGKCQDNDEDDKTDLKYSQQLSKFVFSLFSG